MIKSLSNNSQDIRKYFMSLHKNSGSVRANSVVTGENTHMELSHNDEVDPNN